MALSFLKRFSQPRYFAHCEYWVYLPGEQLPAQERLMDRVLRGNPHHPEGKAPIGTPEALLFSDIRLHIALVLRKKNPHVFRPDLFDEHVEPTPETLAALAESQSFAKVRFISEEPLPDRRHLQLLPHAADAISGLATGKAIYDVVAQKITLPEQFSRSLDERHDLTVPSFHARAVWRKTPSGGLAETRGLVKVGLPELATDELDADIEVLAKDLLEEAISVLWPSSSLPETVDVSSFEDRYRIELHPRRKSPARAVLMKLGSESP